MVPTEVRGSTASPCLCDALRQASRAVSRLYDEELRGVVLRTTQFSLLDHLHNAGDPTAGPGRPDVAGPDDADSQPPTPDRCGLGCRHHRCGPAREARPRHRGRGGELEEARPAWERAQARMRSRLPEASWSDLLATLPNLASLAGEV